MKNLLNKYLALSTFLVVSLLLLSACKKTNSGIDGPPYQTANSFTLFKPGQSSIDLLATDTVPSMAGLGYKYIPVSGAAGASAGLKEIVVKMYLAGNDSLINTKTITKFSRPDYHILSDEQINIPNTLRGHVYKIEVTATDLGGNVLGTKSFYGVDVVSCEAMPNCIVPNQITIMLEAPSTTLPEDDIYLFGSMNGWDNNDQTYHLTRNPDVDNCYCITVPFPPGQEAWQLGEIFVTRGSWDSNALTNDGETLIVNYNAGDMGPIFKIVVPKWRDRP